MSADVFARTASASAPYFAVPSAGDEVADYALSGDDVHLTATGGSPCDRLLRLDARRGALANAVEVRAQADVVIDELNAGRAGSAIAHAHMA